MDSTFLSDIGDAPCLLIGEKCAALAASLSDAGARVQPVARLAEYAGAPVPFGIWPEALTGVRHPLLALERLCALTTQAAFLHAKPMAWDDQNCAVLRLDEAENWQMTRAALVRLTRSAGFAHISVLSESETGLWIKAARQWPDASTPGNATLTIQRAFNPVTQTNEFPLSGRRAFLALHVSGLPRAARRWETRVSVGPFGIQPIFVGATEHPDITQINAPIPPGLHAGSTAIRVWHRQAYAEPVNIKLVEGTEW